MKKTTLVLLILCLNLVAISQRRNSSYSMMNGKKSSDIFPDNFHIKYTGWQLDAGITNMKPQTFSFVKSIFVSDVKDSIPGSRLGLYLGVGKYKLFNYYSVFRFLDYGIAYKSYRGKERIKNGENLTFADHFLSGYFNLNNTIPIGKYNYWGNSIGINTDYAFTSKRDYALQNTPRFQASLHYKVTFAYKATKTLMLIPSIETPILNLNPFYYGSSSFQYLSSRYRPIILSVKFMFLRPIKDVCPPVYAPGMLEDYTPTDMGQ